MVKCPHFSPDVSVLLGLLSQHGVRHFVVGCEVMIHYGLARLTGDIDISCEPTADNAHAPYDALREFWLGAIRGIVDQFGVPLNRIDLLNTIEGVSFEECWTHRVEPIVSPDVPVTLIITSTAPIIAVYPFRQRCFVKV